MNADLDTTVMEDVRTNCAADVCLGPDFNGEPLIWVDDVEIYLVDVIKWLRLNRPEMLEIMPDGEP